MKRVLVVLSLLFLSTGLALADGPETGTVSGKVTNAQGEALPGVMVTIEGDRGTQTTVTDESGNYELLFAAGKPGAAVGRHRVTVETKRFHIPDSVERVPAKYNRETQLEEEVVAGEQTINLDLQSG